MEIDQFLELVRKRRSIRAFKKDMIPDEFIMKIIEAARWAMSGGNAQPWEFIIVKKEETKKRIAAALFEQRKIEYSLEQTREENLRHPGFSEPPIMPVLGDAPVLIVVCGDRRTLMATVQSNSLIPGEGLVGAPYLKNMANATHNMQLAATALGLSSGWVSVSRSSEQSIKVILDVPDLIEIHSIVPVGYPAYKAPPGYRRDLKDIVHLEMYDKSRFRSMDEIIRYVIDLRKQSRKHYSVSP